MVSVWSYSSSSGLRPILEGVVLGDLARDAAAIVFDREVIGGEFDLHEMLRIVDVAAIREAERTIEAVVEEISGLHRRG